MSVDMRSTYTVVEARNHLPDLIARAQAGEYHTITRYGRPAAGIGPLPSEGEETRTVKLPCGGTVTLNLDCRPLMLKPDVRELVFDVIEAFKKLEAATTETGDKP